MRLYTANTQDQVQTNEFWVTLSSGWLVMDMDYLADISAGDPIRLVGDVWANYLTAASQRLVFNGAYTAEFETGVWHHITYAVNLDDYEVYCAVDGVFLGRADLPSGFNGIKRWVIYNSGTAGNIWIDNIKLQTARKTPEILGLETDGKTAEIKLNGTVDGITADDIELCYGENRLTPVSCEYAEDDTAVLRVTVLEDIYTSVPLTARLTYKTVSGGEMTTSYTADVPAADFDILSVDCGAGSVTASVQNRTSEDRAVVMLIVSKTDTGATDSVTAAERTVSAGETSEWTVTGAFKNEEVFFINDFEAFTAMKNVVYGNAAPAGEAPDSEDEIIKISYDEKTRAVTAEAAHKTAAGGAATMHIVKTGSEVGTDLPPVASALFTASANGGFGKTLTVPEDTESGKYTVIIGASDFDEPYTKEIIIYSTASDEFAAALEQINNAETAAELRAIITNAETAAALGINTDDIKYPAQAAEILLALRNAETGGKLTSDVFKTASRYAFADSELENGDDMSEIMAEYSDALGCDYSEYSALDDDMKAELAKVWSESDAADGMRSFDEMTVIAALRLCATAGEVREIYEQYSDIIGADLSGKYAQIKTSSKPSVFSAILKAKSGIVTTDDAKSVFDSAVASVLASSSSSSSGGGGGGGGGGGSGSSSKTSEYNPISGSETSATVSGGTDTPMFSDISGHWAEENIIEMAEKGIINGYDDGTFRPDAAITRAELCSLIYRLAGTDAADGGTEFYDVAEDAWYAECVRALASVGIVEGDGGSFRPDDYITREETAVIAMRTLRVCKTELEGNCEFSDSADISDYAAEAVGALAANGIILGSDNCFYPKNNITRAETATIIDRLYEVITK